MKSLGLYLDFEKCRIRPQAAKLGVFSLTRLQGDASTRRYYRMIDSVGTWVVVKQDRFDLGSKMLPFLEVQSFLESRQLPVPAVFGIDARGGIIILEDLGDQTLLHRLKTVKSKDQELKLYEKAVELLVRMQVRCTPGLGKSKKSSFTAVPRIRAMDLAFDVKKLMWEVDFGIHHLFEGYLKRKVSPRDLATIRAGFLKICGRLSRERRVFTHRDYHSRNLMIRPGDGELAMIDFQDARMGLPQYDLVSLLRDSYYRLDETAITKLKDHYLMVWREEAKSSPGRAHFDEIFDWMTVQRNFKAIGSFASFYHLKKNPAYLRYISHSFENLRSVLLRLPEFQNLREALFGNYYF